MRFEDLCWFDLEEYLKEDDRILFITGACEQHAYLSLLTDIKIPLALADEASRVTGVPVAPPLNFGISPYFLDFPGTLSLSVETFLRVVEELLESAYQQGFRRFLILNGHGGNHPLTEKLTEMANRLPDINIRFHAWFESSSVQEVIRKQGLEGGHANWLEAFSFTRVGALPEREKEPVEMENFLPAEQVKSALGDGSFGGRYLQDDAVLEEIFQAALGDILALLKF